MIGMAKGMPADILNDLPFTMLSMQRKAWRPQLGLSHIYDLLSASPLTFLFQRLELIRSLAQNRLLLHMTIYLTFSI